MTPDERLARFRELAEEAQPMRHRTAEISLEMVQLSQSISLDLVKTAFPKAEIITIQALVEIKPIDSGNTARSAIASCQQNEKFTPDTIIVDQARATVTLAKLLPQKAKSKAQK